jgi:hypothetical protein
MTPTASSVILLPIHGGRRTCKGNGCGKHRGEKIVAYARVRDDAFTRSVLQNMSWSLQRGYPRVNVNGTTKKLHKFVYEHYHGPVPLGYEIDHKDRDKLNATPENLRAVTRSVNNANKGCTKNRSGFKGVSACRMSSGHEYWRAKVKVNGRVIFSRLFPFTEEGKRAAAHAVNEGYRAYYPEVTVPNPTIERETSS